MKFELVPAAASTAPPKVSVVMTAFNHEKFIAQAVESVLMQCTSFRVELVVGEDCSTDGTRQIVLDYQRRHPDRMQLLLWHENAGGGENFVRLLDACRGEYVAFCEGDDYWTDPEKLQRQVDFMDRQPEMALCHHLVDYVSWEHGPRQVLQSFPPELDRRTRTAKDLLERNFIQTCSLLLRRRHAPVMNERFRSLKLGDWPLCYLAAEHGSIGFLDRNMADYRIHQNNSWFGLSSGAREFETARMFAYLAEVAARSNRQACRDAVLRRMRASLAGQPTGWLAFRLALRSWQGSVLTSRHAARVLLQDIVERAAVSSRRYPRIRAWVKRYVTWPGLRAFPPDAPTVNPLSDPPDPGQESQP